MSSRLIRGHEAARHCRWQAPEVQQPLRAGASRAEEERQARAQAVRAGFEEGRRTGLEAARQEIASRVSALERTLDALSRPFEMLEPRFHEEVVALVKSVARALVRRELQLDPTHVAGVVRECLAALPMAATDVVVRLHPEDAAVLRDCLASDDGDRAWRIEADPLLERGGCLVLTPESQVDGRLETLLGRVITALFEDERDADPPGRQPGE